MFLARFQNIVKYLENDPISKFLFSLLSDAKLQLFLLDSNDYSSLVSMVQKIL